MKEKYSDKIYFLLVLAGCVAAIVGMLYKPQAMSEAAKSGIDLCAEVMIPTLFPFFIVTAFLLRSSAIDFLGAKIERFSSRFLKTSGKAFAVFILSLFSGFPVGASLISNMTEEKKISKSEGSRLICCCVNAGPAFVISAVGHGMYGNRKLGIILFASLTLSAIIVFLISGEFTKKDLSCEEMIITKPELSSCLVASVSDATKSIVSVCGWIVAFSCISTFLTEKAEALTMFFEVSLGCKKAAGYPLPVTALIIGWGGLCVHCQVFHAVLKTGMKKINFFFFRMLNGALSAGICALILRFFPQSVQTFSASSQAFGAGMSSNAVACAGLLLMCSIIIVDFEENRNRKSQISVKNKKRKNHKIIRKNEII